MRPGDPVISLIPGQASAHTSPNAAHSVTVQGSRRYRVHPSANRPLQSTQGCGAYACLSTHGSPDGARVWGRGLSTRGGGGAPQWRISAASHAYAVFSFLLASVSEAGLLMATKQPGPMSVKPALRHLLAISQTHRAVQGASQVSRRFQSWVGREAQQTDTWSHSLPSGSPYYDD